jgi:hypothetical protein
MSGKADNRQEVPGSSESAARSAEHAATERANHRLTVALFGGILAVAAIGVTISAIAMSVMGPRHNQASRWRVDRR